MPCENTEGLSNWMSSIQDGKVLKDLYMPGSHDAAMYKCTDTSWFVSSTSVITQSCNIYDQLMVGYRMFDVRVYPMGGELYTGHFAEVAGRGVADMGGYGPSLKEVLEYIKLWLTVYTTETVILRLSHYKPELFVPIVEKVYLSFGDLLFSYETYNPQVCRDSIPEEHKQQLMNAPVASIPLKYLKGKVIVVYEKIPGSYSPTSTSMPMPISFVVLNGDGGRSLDSPQCKLVLNGEYSNKLDASDIIERQKKNFEKKKLPEKVKNHSLLQLYLTSTASILNPFSMNISENTKKLWESEWINLLCAIITAYRPQIIWTDFANADKAWKIIAANFVPSLAAKKWRKLRAVAAMTSMSGLLASSVRSDRRDESSASSGEESPQEQNYEPPNPAVVQNYIDMIFSRCFEPNTDGPRRFRSVVNGVIAAGRMRGGGGAMGSTLPPIAEQYPPSMPTCEYYPAPAYPPQPMPVFPPSMPTWPPLQLSKEREKMLRERAQKDSDYIRLLREKGADLSCFDRARASYRAEPMGPFNPDEIH